MPPMIAANGTSLLPDVVCSAASSSVITLPADSETHFPPSGPEKPGLQVQSVMSLLPDTEVEPAMIHSHCQATHVQFFSGAPGGLKLRNLLAFRTLLLVSAQSIAIVGLRASHARQ